MKNLLLLTGLFLSGHFLSNAQTFVEETTKDTITISQVARTRTVVDTAVTVTRKKYNPPPVVQPPVTPPTRTYAGYSLMYSTGYDVQADIVNGSNQLGQGSISTSRYKTGPGSFKSLVNSSSASNVSSGYRSEVQYSGNYSKDGDEIIVEYDTYYEKTFSTNGLNTQWHGNASNTSGQLSLWVQNGKFMVMRSVKAGVNIYQSGTLKTIETGKWYKIKWEIRFSPGSDGYVRLYIDDMTKPYYSATGRTSDGTGQYLKIGTNRWNVSSESIVYFDNLKIWKKDKSTGQRFRFDVESTRPVGGLAKLYVGASTTPSPSPTPNDSIPAKTFKLELTEADANTLLYVISKGRLDGLSGEDATQIALFIQRIKNQLVAQAEKK